MAAEIAIATVHFDGSELSDNGARIEERLDRQLQAWLQRSLESFDLSPQAAARNGALETSG